MAVTNSYITMCNTLNAPKLAQKEFRLILAEQLVGDFTSRKQMGAPGLDQRLRGKHFLTKGQSQKCAVCVFAPSKRRKCVAPVTASTGVTIAILLSHCVWSNATSFGTQDLSSKDSPHPRFEAVWRALLQRSIDGRRAQL